MAKIWYEWIDKLVIFLTSLILGNIRYFRKSLHSTSFETHIKRTIVEVPDFDGKGVYQVTGETLEGTLETSVVVRLWKGYEYPTIFYQHGNVERILNLFPYRENVFKRIFYPKPLDLPDYNLILIRSFMDGEIREHQYRMQFLNYFMARLAFYTVLEEKIIQMIRAKSPDKKKKTPVILAGIGFGGTVVNLHRAFYNTASAYSPMLAGADLSHVFTESDYKRLTYRPSREKNRALESTLNFETEFLRVMNHNVYPLLARYDRVAIYKHQSRGYETKPISIIDKGHFTTFSDTKTIRKHMLKVIGQVQNEK